VRTVIAVVSQGERRVNVDARITVVMGDGASPGAATREIEDLAGWLSQERGLGVLVDLVPLQAEPTYLGGLVDIALAAMGSGGLAVPLYRSLVAWLNTKSSRLKVVVTSDRGEVTVEATNADEDKVRRLLTDVLYGPAIDEPAACDDPGEGDAGEDSADEGDV
jgi:hypothetical protein